MWLHGCASACFGGECQMECDAAIGEVLRFTGRTKVCELLELHREPDKLYVMCSHV